MSRLRPADGIRDAVATAEAALLESRDLRKHFPIGAWGRRSVIRAVDDISFSVRRGEVLGIVGESGCGKSTAARLMMHLIAPDQGEVLFEGQTVGGSTLSLKAFRRQAQMVFQDSHSSLNPRLNISDSVTFGLLAHGTRRRDAETLARKVLSDVGLDPARFASAFPHELSGGQRQRVNIARALALDPRLVIFDEAVSALDKSVEAQVLTLIGELKRQRDLTYIFISHDLNVISFLCDRVLVMYLGKVLEIGPVEAVYRRPGHPYTQALLASRTTFDPKHRTQAAPLAGDPPSPVNPPSGCRFRTRCPLAQPVCAEVEPLLASFDGHASHRSACHFAGTPAPFPAPRN
jgi:peptide/nickel transport system ATP-binding protein